MRIQLYRIVPTCHSCFGNQKNRAQCQKHYSDDVFLEKNSRKSIFSQERKKREKGKKKDLKKELLHLLTVLSSEFWSKKIYVAIVLQNRTGYRPILRALLAKSDNVPQHLADFLFYYSASKLIKKRILQLERLYMHRFARRRTNLGNLC